MVTFNFFLDLEKMYHEIIKMIDPEKLSNYSKNGTLDTSSSFSSSNNSMKPKSNQIRPNSRVGMRSTSQQKAQKNEEIKFVLFDQISFILPFYPIIFYML